MKHTPGPWEISSIVKEHTQIKTKYGKPGMDYSELIPVSRMGPGINEMANAKLIAAAPHLLDVLKFALEMQESVESIRPHHEGTPQNTIAWMDEAREAIRKATD